MLDPSKMVVSAEHIDAVLSLYHHLYSEMIYSHRDQCRGVIQHVQAKVEAEAEAAWVEVLV